MSCFSNLLVIYFTSQIASAFYCLSQGVCCFGFKSSHPCGFLSKAVEATRVAIRIPILHVSVRFCSVHFKLWL